LAGEDRFEVTFWGVRGSIACPGQKYVRYGGNTSCVAMRCGERLLIFDAGTGLRPLGTALSPQERCECDIFLTHTHFDHIAGLPFFQPIFREGNRVRLWSGHLTPETSLHQVLCEFMMAPLFPVPPSIFGAEVDYLDFRAGEELRPEAGIVVRTAPLNHPNRATGYRVEYGGRAACYVTDTEHREGERDSNILDLVAGADIMIYDASYTDEEYPRYRNWGHSTWQEGLRIAEAAGVGRAVLFHHDPTHDDETMDRIAEEAERARPGTLTAREGMTISL
jgi:phosphoribosyl 1,2-cyclic phosphodiesterase